MIQYSEVNTIFCFYDTYIQNRTLEQGLDHAVVSISLCEALSGQQWRIPESRGTGISEVNDDYNTL